MDVFQHSSLLLTSLKSKKCRELPIFSEKVVFTFRILIFK